MSEDYKAHLKRQRRERLEKVALSVLQGLCANATLKEQYSGPIETPQLAIQVAKEFIKQIDEENNNENKNSEKK